MADMRKLRAERTARKPVRAPQVQTMAPLPKPAPKKKPFESPIHEPSREELNPLSRLFFDANLCLNSYLDALKASSSPESRHPQASFNRPDAKGVGAT